MFAHANPRPSMSILEENRCKMEREREREEEGKDASLDECARDGREKEGGSMVL
jgi:hypothetical protein